MKIKSMTPHFGCKRTLAPQIVAEFGPHRAYWEPFCGSAAVLFAKPKSSAETICDLHLGVTAIARVLQDDAQTERLYARMARTFSCDAVYQDALAAVVASPSDPEDLVDYAANYLIVSWQGRNGTAGLKLSDKSPRPARRWSSGGGNTATRWRSVVDSIPDWVDRLRGVNVLQEDGLAALSKIRDEAGTVIYCDPPYVEKSDQYEHDFSRENHEWLAHVTRRRFSQARVLISYYDHPLVRELYPEPFWRWKRLTATKAMTGHGGGNDGGKTNAPEVLICNQR